MTKHEKPLSDHDKKVLEDLARIEREGVPQEEGPVVGIDVGAISRVAGGPSLGEAMSDASGIGAGPVRTPPMADDENSALPHVHEGPQRMEKEGKPNPSLPKIDTGE